MSSACRVPALLLLSVVVLLLSSLPCALCDVPSDEITTLPGWSGKLPSRQYSGYFSTAIDGSKAGRLHYWLTLSEKDPKNDPLVLWLQGGPGCSSLFGLMYENGQLMLAGDPQTPGALPQLVYNNQSWTKAANMIWLEQPIGVGFSYCENATADCSGQNWGLDAYHFFLNFFAAYPELSKNPFHISGESWGGVYCPYVADAILTGNAEGSNPPINLKGMLVGNGVGGDADENEMAKRESDFWYGHAGFSYQAQLEIERTCGNFSNPGPDCQQAVNKAESGIGGFYIYDIYDTCPHDLEMRPVASLTDSQRAEVGLFAPIRESRVLQSLAFTCVLESTSSVYLDTPVVQKALHVTAANLTHWSPCGFNEVQQHRLDLQRRGLLRPNSDLGDLYKKLIPQIPILIYSGDVDQCVPYYYSDSWTRLLGFKATEVWRAWQYGTEDNMQVGGYVTTYADANGFTFLTVRGSGHMVPQYQPQAALAMLQKYLSGNVY